MKYMFYEINEVLDIYTQGPEFVLAQVWNFLSVIHIACMVIQ